MTDSRIETLDGWLERIEQCHPETIELGLDRVRQVADRLPINLSNSRKVVVAGTNGKGSTSTMLESILRQAGFSTGLYTSPHFLRYNERVRLNGLEASDEALCRAFEQVDKARGEIALTYFEYGTLAALLLFSEAAPDYVILEIGLGGRLDAVNIVDSDVAVLTTVALDHEAWLGSDVETIGREKAGIFRAGKPAVCGMSKPPKTVVEHAADLGISLSLRDHDYGMEETADGWNWESRSHGEFRRYQGLVQPSLPLVNAAVVLEVLKQLGLDLDVDTVNRGLVMAHMTGRMQQITVSGRHCVLDVAHNPEAAQYLSRWLEEHPVAGKTHVLIGMLADKDQQHVFSALAPQADDWTLVGLGGPRGTSTELLKEHFDTLGITASATAFENVAAGLTAVLEASAPADRIVICGSFVTVTDALISLGLDG